jgi:FSR family fosmidomycin resistance protein-like MFS transporter
MHKFGLSIQDSQFHLFLFLASVAAGTDRRSFGDRFGRNTLFDIHFGSPFTLLLPYANLFWTGILSVIIGVVIAFFGNFSFAQELMPGKVGMISGLFFGFAFGMEVVLLF